MQCQTVSLNGDCSKVIRRRIQRDRSAAKDLQSIRRQAVGTIRDCRQRRGGCINVDRVEGTHADR